MEGKNQSGSSFSDLFGAKESPPSTSSTGIFASMFPPPSTVQVSGKNPPSSDQVTGSWQKHSSRNHQLWNTKQGASARSGEVANRSITNKNRNSNFQEERVEPCHLSSSLYYGGQDIYSQSPNSQAPGSYPMFKQDGGEDDMNGNNSQSASRGNWWQGSLYY